MQALLIDAFILLILLLAAWHGIRRGLFVQVGLVDSLLVAIVLAALGYSIFGGFISQLLGTPRAVANILAYIAILFGVQIAGLFIVHANLGRLVRRSDGSFLSRELGALLATLQVGFLIAILFGLLSGLPGSGFSVPSRSLGPVSNWFGQLGNRMQTLKGLTPASDINKVISMLTVDPESTQFIPLSFTTTHVTVDPIAETRMLGLINTERAAQGLTELKLNPAAQVVAREHCRDMLAQGYFSHINLQAKNPFDRMQAGGVAFNEAGENLALAPTLQKAHEGLMKSPGHRANILNPNYGTVGIGVVDAGSYGLMITQEFTN